MFSSLGRAGLFLSSNLDTEEPKFLVLVGFVIEPASGVFSWPPPLLGNAFLSSKAASSTYSPSVRGNVRRMLHFAAI